MTSMTTPGRVVIGGVDTHRDTHHAAVLDEVGRQLGDRAFPATPAGYAALLRWLRRHGEPARVGVEGTGAYGAGLARSLSGQGVPVVEVDRPDRRARRAKGKSDPLDAVAAARAAASGQATGTPKAADGPVEAIRALRVARRGAVKARTQTINALRGLLVTAPAGLREQLRELSPAALIAACARLRPPAGPIAQAEDPALAGVKTALRTLARRHQQLSTEITELNTQLGALTRATAPELIAVPGVGPEVAGQLLVTDGDNPTGCAARPPSRTCAGPPRSRPAAAAPTGTGSTAAATGPPTTPCTPWSSTGCATTRAPAPTPPGDAPKA
jgi:transposase